MSYDPKRSRHRPEPADDGPAPVDALLGGEPDPVPVTDPVDAAASPPAGETIAEAVASSTDEVLDTPATPETSAAPETDAATEPVLPDGVAIDVTDGGQVVVHTTDADVEITSSGDDVVVRTDDATVEVRPEVDEVRVSAGAEDIYVDTTPRADDDLEKLLEAEAHDIETSRRLTLVLAALVAAALAAVLAAALRRRHHEG